MNEIKLTPEEVQALRAALQSLVIRHRTGELGIIHGADRFVGTTRSFSKIERAHLDSLARRVGIPGGIRVDAG